MVNFNPRTPGYDFISRANHWIIAFGMMAMIAFGIYVFKVLPRGPEKIQLIELHKAIGVLILVYGIWRVGYRLAQGFLQDAAPMPKWQASLAKIVHLVLLAAVVVMPLSGIFGSFFDARAIDVFGLFTIPAGPKIEALSDAAHWVHETYVPVMILALILHVLGALKHHFIDRDDTMKRMVRSL